MPPLLPGAGTTSRYPREALSGRRYFIIMSVLYIELYYYNNRILYKIMLMCIFHDFIKVSKIINFIYKNILNTPGSGYNFRILK